MSLLAVADAKEKYGNTLRGLGIGGCIHSTLGKDDKWFICRKPIRVNGVMSHLCAEHMKANSPRISGIYAPEWFNRHMSKLCLYCGAKKATHKRACGRQHWLYIVNATLAHREKGSQAMDSLLALKEFIPTDKVSELISLYKSVSATRQVLREKEERRQARVEKEKERRDAQERERFMREQERFTKERERFMREQQRFLDEQERFVRETERWKAYVETEGDMAIKEVM